MRTTFMILFALFLASCSALSSSPVVLTTQFDGWGYVWADGARLVAVGVGRIDIAMQQKGSPIAMGYTPIVQEGDYLVIADGESHHLPYSDPLPFWAEELIPDTHLRELRARGIVLTFDPPTVAPPTVPEVPSP